MVWKRLGPSRVYAKDWRVFWHVVPVRRRLGQNGDGAAGKASSAGYNFPAQLADDTW
jgi:hypothetical protein